MKKYIVALLLVTLLIQPSYAVAFTDLEPAKWAEPYIVDLAEMGIVNGYRDKTYRPLESVSYYAAILVLYRTLDAQGLVDSGDVAIYVNRYQSILSEYDVPGWPELDEAVAYSIEKGIIEPADLRRFMDGGEHAEIPRQMMALYMARALNEFFAEDLQRAVELPFVDAAEIAQSCRSGVALLQRHGIITGDDKGYFKPLDSLNRAALAKLLVTGIAELSVTDNVTNRNIAAYVYVKLDETKKIIFYKLDSKTESYSEQIGDDVEVIVDGKLASYDDLKRGQDVVLTYANSKLKRVRVGDYDKVVEGDIVIGVITDVADFNGERYLYLEQDGAPQLFFYKLSDDVSIVRAGENIAFDGLHIGDKIKYTLQDGVIVTVRY